MVTAAAFLGVVLLALGGTATYRDVRSIDASNTIADQVAEVELASERLLSHLKDSETGQRGYLLTGDPAYLEPYEDARKRLDDDLGRLRAAPLTSPERARQVSRIGEMMAAKLAELDQTIALYDAGQRDAAIKVVRSNRGKQIMDAIRVEVDGFQTGAVARLLQARSLLHSNWSWVEAAVLTTLGGVVLGGVVWARGRIREDAQARFYRRERFTRAFGMSKGTLRDLEGRILFWSVGAQRLYGFSPEEALGSVCHQLLQTDFPQPLEQIRATLLRDGEWQGELACRHRDGSALHVISTWALSRGEAGEPDAVIEVAANVTAVRIAERKREEADALLRTILETTPGLIYAKDRQGRMILANASTWR